MHNLKPCPFCGATEDNEFNDLILSQVPPAHYQIKCGCCGVTMKWDRKDKVIGIWNNRDLDMHKNFR